MPLCAISASTRALISWRSTVQSPSATHRSEPEPPTGNLGITPSEPLRRLEAQVLRQELPTPSAPGLVVPRVRPLPRSSFVGRDDDLQRVVELLAVRQVVSIVGPGGVGKTRLARHAADAVRDRYTDGVIWVELSSLVDAADVPAVIANDLRLSVAPGEALLDQVADALAGRRVLVVLDNCEHLADGVAVVADRIAGASTVDVLMTSRVPLRADDEQVVVLAPLAERDAARLFLDRLAAVAAQDVAPPADADDRRRDRRSARRSAVGARARRGTRARTRTAWPARCARRAVRRPQWRSPFRTSPLAARCRRMVRSPAHRRAARAVRRHGRLRRTGRAPRRDRHLRGRRAGGGNARRSRRPLVGDPARR